jgi:DNA-binding LacI/PurR family transcriptional regulator
MPTIKDVAKLANVSTATVSAALNGTAYVSPKLKEPCKSSATRPTAWRETSRGV